MHKKEKPILTISFIIWLVIFIFIQNTEAMDDKQKRRAIWHLKKELLGLEIKHKVEKVKKKLPMKRYGCYESFKDKEGG